jgi:hypothetical protein
MRYLFLAVLTGVCCANAVAQEIPGDVRVAFEESAKENVRQIARLKSVAATLDATRRQRDPGRTREQAQAMAKRSTELHDEIAARQKTIPPIGLWNALVPMEVGRIGIANVKARIEKVVDARSVEAIQFTDGAPVYSKNSARPARVPSGHTIGEPFIVTGIDTAKFTTGAVVDEFPGLFRVDRTTSGRRTIFELTPYDAAQLRNYFDQLQSEAKAKQKR